MLEEASPRIEEAHAARHSTADEAEGIYEAIHRELLPGMEGPCRADQGETRLEAAYSISRETSGAPLRDSFHLGSTIINDYGRPYANGYNDFWGISGYATAGRFALYLRTEFQGAPSATGYSPALYQQLADIDSTVNPVTGLAYPGETTISGGGAISAATDGRFLEAYVSFQHLYHVILFRQRGRMVGTGEGRELRLLEQRRESPRIPYQPRRAAVCPLAFAPHLTVSLRVSSG